MGVVSLGRHRSLCVVGGAQLLDGIESMFINRVSGYPCSSTPPEMLQKCKLARSHQGSSLILPPLHSVSVHLSFSVSVLYHFLPLFFGLSVCLSVFQCLCLHPS